MHPADLAPVSASPTWASVTAMCVGLTLIALFAPFLEPLRRVVWRWRKALALSAVAWAAIAALAYLTHLLIGGLLA